MKTLYLDICSGLSGDMLIGALLDLGVDFARIERELRKLQLHGYHLHAERRQKSQVEGVKFDVHLDEAHLHTGEPAGGLRHSHTHHHGEHEHEHEHGHHHDEDAHVHDEHGHEHSHGHGHEHRHEASVPSPEPTPAENRDFGQIRELIQRSALSDWVKQRSIAVFQRVAVAEGKIHGKPPEQVHFHEVGAIDSIVDIVGACIALELLGKPRVLSGPVVDGTGWVRCAHGRFPVPTPATLEILGARGVAVSQCDEPHELLTPTGAALLAEFAESFGPMTGLEIEKIGYGLGTRENKTRPNLTRAILAQSASAANSSTTGPHDWEIDTISVLEANIDDCSGEILGHFMERALSAGALDVFHTPIQMKKNRPGVLLTVLCAPDQADEFTAMLLTETSSFGVRRGATERRKLRRKFVNLKTPYGEVQVKLGELDGKLTQVAPEFESCKSLAAAANVPISTVYRAAEQASRELKPSV